MTFIRTESPADVPVVRDLVATAFGDDKVARLVDLIRRSPYFLPRLSLVAEVDATVAGYVRRPLTRVGPATTPRPRSGQRHTVAARAGVGRHVAYAILGC